MNKENLLKLSSDEKTLEAIFYPSTIRKKSLEIFTRAQNGETHFKINLNKLKEVSCFVKEVTLKNYPDLNIPFHSRWNHFQAGDINRLSELEKALMPMDDTSKIKAKIDLVVMSVLLDAGAGMAWQYSEEKTGKIFSRSEGLGVATFRMFMSGTFSSDPQKPLACDAKKLTSITVKDIQNGFKVNTNNPLVGVEGRCLLLNNLGKALQNNQQCFKQDDFRIGNLIHYFNQSCPDKKISAVFMLRTIQASLGSIWPGRITLNGINIGDVWSYSCFDDKINSLIPFHKLSQWLTYSLIEPLIKYGYTVTNIDQLTGLPEYRNGGLIFDSGLIELKDKSLLENTFLPSDDLMIEWRALTIVFLDEIGKQVRQLLNKTDDELPLARVLEGGTWWAGRMLAQKLRLDGGSPFKIKSDGTVF